MAEKPYKIKINYIDVTRAALMLSTLSVAGQELKKVIKKTSPNQFSSVREEYNVLADEANVKHGFYKKWVNEKLIESSRIN